MEGGMAGNGALGLTETMVARWLALARLDADRAAEIGVTDPEDAAFHWQQSTEKALKAFLALHGHALKKTHDRASCCCEPQRSTRHSQRRQRTRSG
jgi:hypothetical protein